MYGIPALDLTIILLTIYQLVVTARVLAARQYTWKQRLGQFALIWLVPLFGALICHSFVAADRMAPRPRDTSFSTAPENPPGVGQG